MLKLTDKDGTPIYFRIEAIELVRPVVLGESKGANAGVVVSFGTFYVKERPEEIAVMCQRG